jgi:hypothetical protein
MTHDSPSAELNITSHRAQASVWDRRGWDGTPQPLALSRWFVGLGGGALAVQGLRQRSFVGTVLATAGGALAWWALTGEGDLSEAQQRLSCWLERLTGGGGDRIVDASADSFPASDAPAWTAAVGTGARRHAGATR